jgi:hypothetical protein
VPKALLKIERTTAIFTKEVSITRKKGKRESNKRPAIITTGREAKESFKKSLASAKTTPEKKKITNTPNKKTLPLLY